MLKPCHVNMQINFCGCIAIETHISQPQIFQTTSTKDNKTSF